MLVVLALTLLLLYAVLVVAGDLECVEGSFLDDLSYFLTYGVASIANGLLSRVVGARAAR